MSALTQQLTACKILVNTKNGWYADVAAGSLGGVEAQVSPTFRVALLSPQGRTILIILRNQLFGLAACTVYLLLLHPHLPLLIASSPSPPAAVHLKLKCDSGIGRPFANSQNDYLFAL